MEKYIETNLDVGYKFNAKVYGDKTKMLILIPQDKMLSNFLQNVKQMDSKIRVSPFYVESSREIQKMDMGKIIEISLIKNILSFQSSLSCLNVESKIMNFKNGELEQRISNAGEEFANILESLNMGCHHSNFYNRITSTIKELP